MKNRKCKNTLIKTKEKINLHIRGRQINEKLKNPKSGHKGHESMKKEDDKKQKQTANLRRGKRQRIERMKGHNEAKIKTPKRILRTK